MIRSFLAFLVLALVATAAIAQLRGIPADAVRGNMVTTKDMAVEINGKRIELAAGAQIRDQRNMIVLPMALPASALVKYQLGADGKLQRAWILSPQEAAQPNPKN